LYEEADIKLENSLCVILTQKYFCIKESVNIYDYKSVLNKNIKAGYIGQPLPKQVIL